MKESFESEAIIREYLLGKLLEQDELEKKLSDRILSPGRAVDQSELEKTLSGKILFNADLAEMVEAIEDEIIEDYLDDALSSADRKAVEQYFLRPAERREKLKFARLLRESLEKKSAGAPQVAAVKDSPLAVSTWFRFHWRTCAELAAVLLVAVALTYLIKMQDAGRRDQARLEHELQQEREHSASLARELAQVEPPVERLPAFFGLSRGVSRGPDSDLKTHQVEIKPHTERLGIEIGGAAASAYDVRLENDAKTTIWTSAGLTPSSSGDLRFEIPAQGITTGDYQIVLTSRPANMEKSYWFHAKVIAKVQAPSQK